MILRLLALWMLALTLTAPTAAQQPEAMTATECRAIFDDADTNGDGVLSQEEIAAADLDTESGTALAEFVADCRGT
jgi:hypothetical protein